MRIPYKPFPLDRINPAFPEQKHHWWPVLRVQLADQGMHAISNLFYAVVDSGSAVCLFHADFLNSLNRKLEDGIEYAIGGIGKRTSLSVFYHDVRILFGSDQVVAIRAGFSRELAVPGILGRLGFFDRYNVQFDHSVHPPCFEINRISSGIVH